MKSLRWGASVSALAVLAAALTTACHPTFVVLPDPEGDSLADSLQTSEPVRTVVRYDTVVRVDTVEVPTPSSSERADTVVRVDTLRVTTTDTVVRVERVVVRDTVGPRTPRPRRFAVDTVLRVDTVRTVDTVVRVDTLVRVDTVARTDTVTRIDTVARVDTVALTETVVRTDTVRVEGQRVLFLPPGHYPPDGECRVWVHGQPPGRQAKAAPCDELGDIPDGAFVLFGGDAWDFDYDWLAEAERRPGAVPPEIVALKRRGG